MTDAPSPSESTQPPAGGARTSWARGLMVTLLIALLVGVAFFGGAVVSAAFGFMDVLREKQEETVLRPQPSVVTAVRELSRLETVNFHIERVIDLSVQQSRLWGYVKGEDAILLVAAADITAGVDLSKLGEDDVRADLETMTVKLTLPSPEILTSTLDDERTYVYSRETDVLAERKEDLESQARKKAIAELRDAAIDGGIMDRAKKGAERSIEGLMRSIGYERIEIRWR